MAPAPRRKSTPDPARSKARSRRQSIVSNTTVDAGRERAKQPTSNMNNTPQTPREQSDSQLSGVEEALQSSTLSEFLQQENKKWVEDKMTEVVDLLARSLVLDVEQCKREAILQKRRSELEPRSSKAVKGTPKWKKRSAKAEGGTPKVVKDTSNSVKVSGESKKTVDKVVEEVVQSIEIEPIDVDKQPDGSDVDSNSTVSDPYLKRVAVGISNMGQTAIEPVLNARWGNGNVTPSKRAAKSRTERDTTPRKRAKQNNGKDRKINGSGTVHEKKDLSDKNDKNNNNNGNTNGNAARRRTPRKTAEDEEMSSTDGSVFLETVLEEEVLINEGNGNVDFDEENSPPKKKGQRTSLKGTSSLPWWRAVESRMILPAKGSGNEQVLRNYMLAVIRSCVRDSWKAEALRNSYEKDAASAKGRAFLSVSAALLALERAKHMGHCRTKWKQELIQGLSSRRVFQWSVVQNDSSFRQFVGCDACLGHRQATRRLWLSGAKYDSRNFWPSRSIIDVLGASEETDGSLKVAVELNENSRAGQLTSSSEDELEFWVDAQCLRKCLVFHELVHSTSILEDDVRHIIEDLLREGVVHVPKVQKTQKSTLEDRLQKQLVSTLSQDEDFLGRRTSHLRDLLQLGDVYFSAGDAEVLDAGGTGSAGRTRPVSKIYDAPLELNDDTSVFRERIRRLESLTEKKLGADFFSNPR